MVTNRAAVEATVLFEAAHAISPIVANALQEASGGRPGIKEHRIGATAQAIAGVADQLQRQYILGRATFAPQPHPQGDAKCPLGPERHTPPAAPARGHTRAFALGW